MESKALEIFLEDDDTNLLELHGESLLDTIFSHNKIQISHFCQTRKLREEVCARRRRTSVVFGYEERRP